MWPIAPPFPTLATGFSLEEEEIAVALRTELGLSLDDVLEVMRRCLRPDIYRSALHRCLKRRGVSRRPKAPEPVAHRFAPTSFGYVHVDLKHLPRLKGQAAYVFVAIERTTRFVHVEIVQDRSGQTIAACLERFAIPSTPSSPTTEFTDRFGDARWRQRDKGTGAHPFDKVCRHNGIKHRLTRPYRPQTNGMVERFNRRLAEALRTHPPSGENSRRNRFSDPARRNAFVLDFVRDYNRTRLRCLAHKAPAEVLNNLPGHNTCAPCRARN